MVKIDEELVRQVVFPIGRDAARYLGATEADEKRIVSCYVNVTVVWSQVEKYIKHYSIPANHAGVLPPNKSSVMEEALVLWIAVMRQLNPEAFSDAAIECESESGSVPVEVLAESGGDHVRET